MTKQEQLEEMARIIAFDLCPNRLIHANSYGEKAQCYADNNFAECAEIKNVVDKLYNAGYKKTFASDTQKAFQDGYIRGNIDGMLLARKETAKDILQTLYNNLERPYFFNEYIKTLAKQYGVEVEE